MNFEKQPAVDTGSYRDNCILFSPFFAFHLVFSHFLCELECVPLRTHSGFVEEIYVTLVIDLLIPLSYSFQQEPCN